MSVVQIPLVKCSKSATEFNILRVNFFPFGRISSPRSFCTPCEVLPLINPNNLSIRTFLNLSYSTENSISRLFTSSLSLTLLALSFIALWNNFLSITTPLREGEAFKDASLTSPALSPKIALKSFSSGVGSDSPFGVILPIKMSPGLISAPILIIPFSSRSLVASSLTLGMSAVSSSAPNFVSLTSREYSSIWIEVKMSSRTTFSEITMASSKLYPFQGIKATFIFLPKASSPC